MAETHASEWRGHSGRIYPVAVAELNAAALLEAGESVLLAVERDHGIGRICDISDQGPGPSERLSPKWTERARSAGASELHVHAVSGGALARRAVVDDLRVGGKRGPR